MNNLALVISLLFCDVSGCYIYILDLNEIQLYLSLLSRFLCGFRVFFFFSTQTFSFPSLFISYGTTPKRCVKLLMITLAEFSFYENYS